MIRHTITTMIAAATFTMAGAQNTAVPAPEFKNKIYFVSKTNTLDALDNTGLLWTAKSKMMAGKMTYQLEAKGDAAAIAHSGSPKNRFIVKLEEGIDPTDAVELIQFDVNKGKRSINMGGAKAGAFSGAKMEDPEFTKFKFNVEKVQPGVYILTPQTQLPDGEYAFVVDRAKAMPVMGSTLPAFCFSVGQGG